MILPKKSALFLSCLLLVLIGLLSNCSNGSNAETKPLKDGIDESLKPDHVIEFPHDIHVNDNGIDCAVCHYSQTDGKTPALEICMKCHKQINGNQPQENIQQKGELKN